MFVQYRLEVIGDRSAINIQTVLMGSGVTLARLQRGRYAAVQNLMLPDSAVSDPCSLPMESGEGDERLIRWYVDALDRSCNRQCKSFIYRGSKGNQNNFISKSQCEEQCKPQCTNVCGNNGSMLLDGSGKPTHCGPSSLCPDQYWCHVGGDEESTVCCSGTDDVCDQNLLQGTGKYHLTRWHFSKQENQCVSFIYRGAGGNQNMFLTLDDCRNSCPSSYENPCGFGEPLIDGNTPKICSPDSRCPSTYFCHIGDKGVPNYCCPKGWPYFWCSLSCHCS
ncbi:unnamed protein product [Anisakis simplex]|uniref:Papilin (inferred by orthology to a D. melanogaster protein) n=1 Tax=Anisakis simplex TaxID=6269 RepID=A0A0M3KF88_ANISI|nr:unnamed protein product [Anisakis simplex]